MAPNFSLFTIYDSLGGRTYVRAGDVEDAISKAREVAEKQSDEFGDMWPFVPLYVHDHDDEAWFKLPDLIFAVMEPSPYTLNNLGVGPG